MNPVSPLSLPRALPYPMQILPHRRCLGPSPPVAPRPPSHQRRQTPSPPAAPRPLPLRRRPGLRSPARGDAGHERGSCPGSSPPPCLTHRHPDLPSVQRHRLAEAGTGSGAARWLPPVGSKGLGAEPRKNRWLGEISHLPPLHQRAVGVHTMDSRFVRRGKAAVALDIVLCSRYPRTRFLIPAACKVARKLCTLGTEFILSIPA
jgi:hypothetical protein